MTLAFRLQEVRYHYARSRLVLDGLSLDFAAGERTAILGANGTGKSTLLALLDGLIFPAAGRIEAFGRPLSEAALEDMAVAADFRKRVALVFSNPDVQLFSATVWDDIAFGPLQMGLSPAGVREVVERQMESLKITELRDRAPHTLSDGQKKKVAIASSLAIDPEVLLLDEPTNGLDPRTQVWLIEVLNGLHREGKTIIAATHDLGIAGDIADRAVVFGEEGGIAADGPFAEIIANEDLLLKVNLIHEHAHRHGNHRTHVHRHGHYGHLHQDNGGPRPDATPHHHDEDGAHHPPRPDPPPAPEGEEARRLAVMLDHWLRHDEGHADSYREWAAKAQAAGLTEAAREIGRAIDDQAALGAHLQRARASLGTANQG